MTITSKPVRGSWPFEACAAVVGADEVVPDDVPDVVVPVLVLAVLGVLGVEVEGAVLGVELPEWPPPELPPCPASGS